MQLSRLPLVARAAGLFGRRRGFTLIELMVTLAVFAILCLLAMPSFSTWIANNRVRATAEDMANGLRLAQTEALRRSRQTVFALITNANPAGGALVGPSMTYRAVSSGANNWAVSVVPSPGDGGNSTYVRGGLVDASSSGVVITGPAAVCFDALGRVITDTSATVVADSSATGVSAACTVPASYKYVSGSGSQPAEIYQIKSASASGDHPLQIEVGLGGQVRLCNPGQSLGGGTPGAAEGCQYSPS